MKFLAVKNLEKHQHYKERRPPWIKLHQELLEDYEFTRLHDASKAHLISIWLLASRYENHIPYDAEWIARSIHANGPVDIAELVSAGFLIVSGEGEVDSKPLARRKQSAKPEIEGEKEKKEHIAPAEADAPSANWVTRLAAFWESEVGVVKAGFVGGALKPVVAKVGEARTERALRAYVAMQKAGGKPMKLAWFASESQVWIERTASPIGAVDGEMSPTLDFLTRPKAS